MGLHGVEFRKGVHSGSGPIEVQWLIWAIPSTLWSRILLQKLIVIHIFKTFPHVLWNLKIHYYVHKNLFPDAIWTKWIRSTSSHPFAVISFLTSSPLCRYKSVFIQLVSSRPHSPVNNKFDSYSNIKKTSSLIEFFSDGMKLTTLLYLVLGLRM
jgi:hypothetical protein